MKLLEGRYALITGGGRGIGKAVALEFAKNGANVAVTSRTKSELDQTVKEIESYGVEGLSIPTDLSTLEGVSYSVSQYFENFERCDILVNNAGVTQFSTVIEYPIEKVQQLFNLNIMGTYAITKQILPKMIEQGGGKIIITSSVQGNEFFSSKKVAYSTSKAAVTAMGKCLQAEVGSQNIQVNVVLPGVVHTQMMEDLISWGQQMSGGDPPEALAPMYLFFASDLSSGRYKGKVINQLMLFELLPIIRSKISSIDFDINELLSSMKENLSKQRYTFFRQNKELIEFILK
jgi:NAD(P)-dependent dehydrogenase (short-subunit alcohol dehydrogenase family)